MVVFCFYVILTSNKFGFTAQNESCAEFIFNKE